MYSFQRLQPRSARSRHVSLLHLSVSDLRWHASRRVWSDGSGERLIGWQPHGVPKLTL
jgi:hypothetical protein